MSILAETIFVLTNLGKIAIHIHERQSNNIPIIFLHGVYFDHHMWDEQIKRIDDRTVITIDMPLHGESREITKADWSMNDCADMLIEILDSLHISKVMSVGHSWGSMTILRAAHKNPDKFEAICLCNMPFEVATPKKKILFKLQHLLLIFRAFYTKQVAKSMFSSSSLKSNPQLYAQLERTMNILTKKDIQHIDQKIIIEAEDATPMIVDLKVNAIAIKGKEDYVPKPPKIHTVFIDSGHVSPLELPEQVLSYIRTLLVSPP
jgi:pimeloyl-ACP methyl ester carboxylesterase